MTTIIGIAKTQFTGADGNIVSGLTVYTTEPLDTSKGSKGCKGDKFFLSQNKLKSLDFEPDIGQSINVLYNKYGKVQTITLDEEAIDYD